MSTRLPVKVDCAGEDVRIAIGGIFVITLEATEELIGDLQRSVEDARAIRHGYDICP